MKVRSASPRPGRIPEFRSWRLSSLAFRTVAFLGVALLAAVAWNPAYAKWFRHEKPQEAQFIYAAGTEDIPAGCAGRLLLGQEALTFKCLRYTLAIPYSSIKRMQYRPQISPDILKLELKWKVRPHVEKTNNKQNRYFTVRYTEGEATHLIIFDVLPDAMRPYLAEIDLKAGRRVEVNGYEDFEDNE